MGKIKQNELDCRDKAPSILRLLLKKLGRLNISLMMESSVFKTITTSLLKGKITEFNSESSRLKHLSVQTTFKQWPSKSL